MLIRNIEIKIRKKVIIMCGIVGYVGKSKAIETVLSGLKVLEYRGYDSAGIAYLKDNHINIIKQKGRIQNLEEKIDMTSSDLAIGHTRWATHGSASNKNAHPHQVGSITIVHNGIIENYEQIKEKLISKGYQFKSETDTEVACALIDYYYQGDVVKAINQAIKEFDGSYALGIIVKDDNSLYCVRKTSPLIIGCGQNEYYIASDVPAILKYTNKYIMLDDLEIAKLNDSITIYHNLKKVKKTIQIYDEDVSSVDKGRYEHYMLKEINEQPIAIKKTIDSIFDGHIESLVSHLPDLNKYKEFHIVACGSAYHAGLIGKSLIEKYADTRVTCSLASEYRYNKQFYSKKTLVIFISQSGETADTLAALQKTKKDGIDTLAIVNVYKSSIAREAKYVIYTKAGHEIAVATTKAYTCQISILILIALYLSYRKKITSKNDINRIYLELEKLSKLITNLINYDYKCIAKKIYKHHDIFFIGRGIDYYLSMEGSLKLKEISYINSSAYAAGELKHGTISLIEKETPVIAIATNNDLYSKTISNVLETRSRGAYNILISNQQNNDFDELILIPNTSDFLKPILATIPLQLIAYEVAKLNKCDIDKPKNLAKSVTVE